VEYYVEVNIARLPADRVAGDWAQTSQDNKHKTGQELIGLRPESTETAKHVTIMMLR
jgi:hypothetical protein